MRHRNNHRETFDPFKSIKKTAEKAGTGIKKTATTAGTGIKKTATTAGAGIAKTAKTVGSGVTSLPGKIKNKVLAPLWNWITRIWASFKFYVSCVCCVCIASSCFSMGIPQMVYGLVSAATAPVSKNINEV